MHIFSRCNLHLDLSTFNFVIHFYCMWQVNVSDTWEKYISNLPYGRKSIYIQKSYVVIVKISHSLWEEKLLLWIIFAMIKLLHLQSTHFFLFPIISVIGKILFNSKIGLSGILLKCNWSFCKINLNKKKESPQNVHWDLHLDNPLTKINSRWYACLSI